MNTLLQFKRIICSFIIALVANTIWATDYYVDATSGSDSNSGTSSGNAWKSLSKVNSFTFSPGDNLFFKAGEVWNGQLLLNDSGTNGNPIIVDQYGTGNKPIFNGGGLLTNSAATVLLKNAEYLEVNNLEITNTNGATNYQGDLWGILGELDIAGGMEARHIYVRNCYIHDVNGDVATKTTGGIYMTAFGTDPSRYNDLKIENNEIDNVGGLGIANQSSYASITSSSRYPSLNIQIRGNRISNTGRNNLIIRASDGSVVEYNTLVNTSRHDTGHSVFCFNTDAVVMQYNEAYGNTGVGNKDRGAYDADYNCKNTIIQYNYSHDNLWGFAIMKRRVNENVIIRYNISENDQKAIYFYGFEGRTGLTTANFYNNTHYVKPGIQLTVFGSGGFRRTAIKTNFYNNIFYFEDPGSVWGDYDSNTVNFENNNFYNIQALGTNFITSNPLLVSPNSGEQDIDWDNYPNVLTGYKLQSNSPCIDAGRSVANNGGFDFWGEPLYNGAPDIGASEYRSTTNNNNTNISVLEDAHVRGGSNASTNYGSADIIRVKETGNASFARRGYLKFDVSNLNAISSATLNIYGSAQQQIDLSVYKVNNDNWQESNITWNNAPSLSSNEGTVPVQTTDQWYSIDITSLVQGEISGDGILSLGLRDDNNLVKTIDLYSKENGTGQFKAYISVQEQTVVQNVSLSAEADAFVRGGSNANTNYGNDTGLNVKLGSASFTREAYFKFDVSSLATASNIVSAKLVLEPSSTGSTASSTQIQIKAVSDDSWSESGIIWNNKPAQGTVLDSKAGSASTMEWDITSQVQAEASGDGTISLALSSTVAGSNHFVVFNSKEVTNAALRPSLVVEFESGTQGGFLKQSSAAGRADIEASVIEELAIYPNPANNTVYFRNLSDDIIKIEMTGINGKVVSNNLDITTIKNTGLNVSYLPGGLYVIRFLKKNGQIINKKVIVR